MYISSSDLPSLQSQENYKGRKIMNKSSNYESASNFDYQEDFTQFLEEASRKKACKWTSNAAEKEHLDEENKKSRKSWKNSLFSWLKKADHKRSKSTSGNTIRRGHVSGPVNGTGGGITGGRAASSGPITGLFSSTMGVEEYEVPYTCLDQLNNNNTRRLHSYGPVYFVT